VQGLQSEALANIKSMKEQISVLGRNRVTHPILFYKVIQNLYINIKEMDLMSIIVKVISLSNSSKEGLLTGVPLCLWHLYCKLVPA
jgi:hypothetical protein